MNDYQFGNKIYQLRTQLHLTQNDLADMLGISNKAISKWENGVSKPTVNTLNKLSAIFNVDINELLNEHRQQDIYKIVVTGGPCGGKSTGMKWIKSAFEALGYSVLFVHETATELIHGGIAPWTCNDNNEFQKLLMRLQIEKEKIYEESASLMKNDKILIICDRGLLDNKAYMDYSSFMQVIHSLNKNEIELRDHYDAVFHLTTAAKGAEQYYTCENNTARTETAEEARKLDDELIYAWTGHPHFRVIDNTSTFEDKMKKLVNEISLFLGEPEPYEIERKFLIEYPDLQWLEKNPACKKIEIIQTYLNSKESEEIRIRQRGDGIHSVYFKTIKRNIDELKRIEVEERITKEEYIRLLLNADTSKKQIRKTRYCLMENNCYYEIDIYPFWNHQAILEIELSDTYTEIVFPKKIKVIKEVTYDKNYKNSSLANIQ